MYPKKFPIIWKLGAHILIAGTIVMSMVVISINGAGSLRGDSVAINYAGGERTRLYKIAVLLREYIEYKSDTAREEAREEIENFTRILLGLRSGDPQHNLKAAENPEIAGELDRTIGMWENGLRPLLTGLLNKPKKKLPEKAAFQRTYDETIFSFVRDMDGIVKLLEENSTRKVQRYLIYQYVLFSILTVVAVSSFIVIHRVITVPIRRLTEASGTIASGDLSTRTKINTRDEIGELGDSFNKMAERLKESQRIILEREKLAALGTFCTGVAHEIRNPLSSIRMNLNILYKAVAGSSREKGAEGGSLREHFNIALDEVEHMDRILKDILDFSKPSEPRLSLEEVPGIIDASLHMAEKEMKEKEIKVTKTIDKVPPVQMDGGKIKQALLNIYLNSVRATASGGSLKVSASYRDGSVFISVEDDGAGMDPEVRGKIFEPFFTTHPDGTGLGMSLTKKAVEQHNGSISIESTPGRGTRVTLILPTGKS